MSFMYTLLMIDAKIHISPESDVPIYRQIADQVRLHIDRGTIEAGMALPSARSLAAQLGIHFNTVAEAYRELAEQGWIELNQGKRTVVRALDDVRPLRAAEAESLHHRFRHIIAEMRSRGIAASTLRRELDQILWR